MKKTYAQYANELISSFSGEELENQLLALYEKQNSKKSFAGGGNLGLSEINGGFTHEDNNISNIHSGVPINGQATVEVGETIFNPENYVFSDRIKIPGKNYSFADVSKKIKNKFKLRPDDKLSKEAITQDLTKLMNEQEAIKQAKAHKLMSKAAELSPEVFQAFGGTLPSARQALAPKKKQTNLPTGDFSDLIQDPYGDSRTRTTYPINKKGDGGSLTNVHSSAANSLHNKKAMKNFYNSNFIEAPYKNPNLFPNGGDLDENGFPIEQSNFTNPNEVVGINNPDYRIPIGMGRVQPNNMDFNSNNPNPYNNLNNLIPNNNLNPVNYNDPNSTEDDFQSRVLSSTKLPQDLSGINAGMFGLQAAGEALRLGLTPNSKLAGNLHFNRVNTYPQEVIARKQAQEAQNNLLNGYRNSGINPSQYLSAATTGLGQIGQNAGMVIAGINNQGQMTNAGIQHQEASANKQLELQRNDIQAQDIANRSNQLGAVGAGLTQNLNTTLKDKGARDMDLYTMQFMNKDNYKIAATQEDADKYGVKIGDYFFSPSGYKTKTLSKIKRKYKG